MKNPILVVNNDPAILASIEEILRAGNYYYVAAVSAREALTKVKGYDFSLALLDLDLDDMTGDEFYDKLMVSEKGAVPVVVFPVDTMDSKEVAALNRLRRQTPVTLLSKPMKEELLKDLFERYGEKKTL